MIDPSLFTAESLLKALLYLEWYEDVEIVPAYTLPKPFSDDKPICVVRFNKDRSALYLRYSKGPRQGFFWDAYGDDFHRPTLALLAILQAPDPNGKHWFSS